MVMDEENVTSAIEQEALCALWNEIFLIELGQFSMAIGNYTHFDVEYLENCSTYVKIGFSRHNFVLSHSTRRIVAPVSKNLL